MWDYRTLNDQDQYISEQLLAAYKSGSAHYLFTQEVTLEQDARAAHQENADDIFTPAVPGVAEELFVVSSDAGDTDKEGDALIINSDGEIELVHFALDGTDATDHVSIGECLGVIALKLDAACAGTVKITEVTDTDSYASVTIAALYSETTWFQAPVGGAQLAYWDAATDDVPLVGGTGAAITSEIVEDPAGDANVLKKFIHSSVLQQPTVLPHSRVRRLEEGEQVLAYVTSTATADITQSLGWLI